MSQPLVLYGKGATPNPVKVAIILKELDIPFIVKPIDINKGEHKQEPFISLNPNGRLPALEDPNTGVTIFESGAIIEYVVETYDKEKKLQIDDTLQHKWAQKSWLHFQVSGQGPYFGQIPYFKMFHWEKNVSPSVVERFEKEVKRVAGVVDSHLKKQGTTYLIGDKLTYADLAFVPWFNMVGSFFLQDWNFTEELPQYAAWRQSLLDRPAVKAIYASPDFQHRH